MPRFTAISEIGSIWFVYLYTKIRIRWLLFTFAFNSRKQNNIWLGFQ